MQLVSLQNFLPSKELKMLSDDAFARLVAEDVKNRVSRSQADYLRMPENRERWKRALKYLLSNLDAQLEELADREQLEIARYESLGSGGIRLVAEVQADIEQRRRKIVRFRFYVETRLDEVNRLMSSSSDDELEKAKVSEFLRSAIQKHHDLIMDNDFEYTEIDEALWDSLDGMWSFDSIDMDRI
jgi:hypothetical protein